MLVGGVVVAPAAAEPRPPRDGAGTPSTSQWLLPWPTRVQQPVRDPASGQDVVPTDPTELTADQALQLFEQAGQARLRRDSAVDTLGLQREQLTVLTERAERSQQRADIAARRAQQSQEDLTDLVRNAYMSGIDPTLASLATSSSTREFTGLLTLPSQVQKAADYRVDETQRLNELATIAQETATTDAFNVTDMQQRIEFTKTSIIQDTRLARAYDEAYLAFINSTSGQAQVGPDGCPSETLPGVLRAGAEQFTATELCQRSVLAAATPQAAEAVKWAFSKLGAPYACKGIGRMGDFRFDCSSLVARAYHETSGIPIASATYAHSTRNMMPWDGVSLDPHYFEVPVEEIAPGDLLLYRSCSEEPCAYQHVTMMLADGFMLHTNSCGDVAHITRAPAFDTSSGFVVARRVLFLESEQALQQQFLDRVNLLPGSEDTTSEAGIGTGEEGSGDVLADNNPQTDPGS